MGDCMGWRLQLQLSMPGRRCSQQKLIVSYAFSEQAARHLGAGGGQKRSLDGRRALMIIMQRQRSGRQPLLPKCTVFFLLPLHIVLQ